LEIVSNKLAYHSEFRQITEDIADFCQQLLLNWDTPTSLTFSSDPEKSARLQLERFLFLRASLTSEKLEELMEAISRRPHSRLVQEQEWTPPAIAGSTDWLQHPASMARDWRRNSSGRPQPSQILDIRKQDSADTPPNRFVKHALGSFRDLCHEVVDQHPQALSLVREARDLGDALDSMLARPFFHDIGRMTRLPLESPVLQQRHGYRDLLRIWLLTESAAALSWDRDDDSYHGPTRNVATLYEYWIFLQLHQLLDEIEGVARDTDNPKPCDDAAAFLTTQKGELVISLKRGKKTCAPFTCTLPGGRVLRIHLYYERVFQWDQHADVPASYSRQFKPDYTLAIFPERFASEADASEAGKVAYLHFDAKYRAENLTAIFGETHEDLDAEKQQAKATATYKRGDLLKMHTYNDAVRRTAGSYILYPGDDSETKLSKFHEIVPGVGAFVLKPGSPDCREALKDFLRDVFHHQGDALTQFRYLADQEHTVIREEPVDYQYGKAHRPTAACIFVFLKEAHRELCRTHRLAYAHVIRDEEGTPVPVRLGDAAGALLCPYEGGRTGRRSTLPWQASIRSTEMLNTSALKAELRKIGWPEDQMPSNAAAYLLFRLDVPSSEPARNITPLLPPGAFHAVSHSLGKLTDCALL